MATNKQRIAVVVAWLAETYPTPHRVEVRLIPKLKREGTRLDGYAYWESSRRCQMLLLRKEQTFTAMLDTLAHEWAHLVHMPNNRQHSRRDLRPHDPLTGWGYTYAAIYSDLFDHPLRFTA